MTKVAFVYLFVLSFCFGFSQNEKEVSVEKSVFGIQIGPIGIWAHNELKLSNQIALRSEIGLAGVNTGDIEPLIALESRWYYNLDKRNTKNKRIDGNSGNYISMRASYRFFDIDASDNKKDNYIIITPTWGIRRNLGKHFNYETGLGFGIGISNDDTKKIDYTMYYNLKIGYRF